MRETVSLDGIWEFRMPPDVCAWRPMPVPSVWQAHAGLRDAVGTAFYRCRFAIPAAWSGDMVVLHFGAVSYHAQIELDGIVLADHEGGWLAFDIVLPCSDGDHELLVQATMPDDDPRRFPDWPFAEIPHGKQSWYGRTGGIWQSVTLERRSRSHIETMSIDAALDGGHVAIGVSVSAPQALRIEAVIVIPDGTVLDFGRHESGARLAQIAGIVPDPLAWSPQAPNVYRAVLGLWRDDVMIDRLERTFGFRTIATRDGRLLLNGRPFVLRGALDQDYYPDTITTPPSLSFLEDQFAKARALGFNCLRCHIKVPDPRYYEVADRLGMLIWADLPNVERFSTKAAARLRETLRGMVARDGHHPSLIAWTLVNEDWGTDLERDPDHRAWLAATYDWMKALDPSRLVVDNSACWPNFHVRTDLDDYHWYFNQPDQRREWDSWLADFAARPAWSFSPHGDAQRRGDEPLVVSEFGNWGLPDLAGLMDPDGAEPWWFETGHERHGGVNLIGPHGIAARFAVWQFDRVFGSLDRFIAATQRHQFRALKYQIETLRRHDSIAGYVVTELTDAHWEANGLMDMRRNLRPFHRTFADVNAPTALLPGLSRWAYRPGETLDIPLHLAVGDEGFAGGVLEWTGDAGTGAIDVPAAGPARTVAIGTARIALAPSLAAGLLRVVFTLHDHDGRVAARNVAEIAILRRMPGCGAIAVWSGDTALRARFAALGYGIAETPDTADLLVAHRLDEALCERVRLGARLLVLATDTDAIEVRADLSAPIARRFPGLQVVARDWTAWRGISTPAWGWLRRDGAYAAIPGDVLFDFAFDRIIPHHVLVGFRPDDTAAHVQAGVIVGWVNMPAAYIGQRFLGRGRATFSTFRLTEDPPDADPMATALLDALVADTIGGYAAD